MNIIYTWKGKNSNLHKHIDVSIDRKVKKWQKSRKFEYTEYTLCANVNKNVWALARVPYQNKGKTK